MFGKIIFTSAVLGMSSGALSAQTYNWDGYYFGGSVVQDRGDIDWVDNNGGWFTFAPGTTHAASDIGLGFGVQAGLLKQWDNNIVGGLEVGFSVLGNKSDVTSPLFPGSDTWGTKVGSLVTATGRIGYAKGRWLPYLEAGLAAGEVSITNTDRVFCGAVDCVFASNKWQVGYTVGIGAEYRTSEKFSIGVSYRFVDLGSATHAGITQNQGTAENFTVNAETQVLSLRLNWMLD